MKRWTRSLPFLLALPATMLACLLTTLLVVSPATRIVIDYAGFAAMVIVMVGQPLYLHFHDKQAFDAVSGLFMFVTGGVMLVVEYFVPMQGLSSQVLLLLHSVTIMAVVGGWATLNGDAKSSLPKRWLFNIGAWQRQSPTVA